MKDKIESHFQQYDFDIRKSNNARSMDQKVVPDVLAAVAECVVEYVALGKSKFTKNDIWFSEYSKEVITAFSKPDLRNANQEYDKFFAQPLKLLAYAQVLEERKERGSNTYQIKNQDVLNYISGNENKSIEFLYGYLAKLMTDSGLGRYFDNFFDKQDLTSLHELRKVLVDFYIKNTAIKNLLEPPRIFNKIINILAFKRKKKGVRKGQLSKTIIAIEDIRYNRINWRDVGKDKNITREEFEKTLFENPYLENYHKRAVNQAKKSVKNLHRTSEIHPLDPTPATQAHHIFMQSEFIEISDSIENIIALTPNQHYVMAHPANNTSVVDIPYQAICLVSKLDSIEEHIRKGGTEYKISEFVHVLNTGFGVDSFNDGMSYEQIKFEIAQCAVKRLNVLT